MKETKKKYVDFYFYACLDELFAVENSYWESNLNGNEIEEIAKSLKINIDTNLIIKNYWNEELNNIEIFHSKEDDLVFIYFDVRRMRTDQNDMFLIGIRCLEEQKNETLKNLIKIYDLLRTTGSFNYEKWGWKFYSLNGEYKYDNSSEYSEEIQINHYR